ncbi:hypothetical protein GCM10009682_10230 [Luedemannella flava]|uniref:Uncharacterized protein n=1 Tax=Luedemannella flava TaxID=349316 RepID=A0ABN2LJW7_9ACTN
MPGHERRQAVAAGDDDAAGRCAGQQRPDLLHVGGVVEHQQDPPAGEHAAQQRGPFGDVLRHGRRLDAERPEKTAQHLPGRHGPVRPVPAQVGVELAVGEPGGRPVRPVDRERGLARAGGARQRRDDDGGHAARPGTGGERVELGQLRRPPGELGDVAGQLSGHRHDALQRAGPGADELAAQDRRVHGAQLLARLDAQLVNDATAGDRERVERLRRVSGQVQRPQQRRDQRLGQGMTRDRRAQDRHGLVVAADVELQARPRGGRVDPLAGQRDAGAVGPVAGDVGERVAAPQVERGTQRRRPRRRVEPGVAAGGDEATEPEQVHPVPVELQGVPTGLADDRGLDAAGGRRGGDDAAHARQVAVQSVTGLWWWIVPPDPFHEGLRRDRRTRVDQQCGENDAVFGRSGGHRLVVNADNHGPEQAKLHRRFPISPRSVRPQGIYKARSIRSARRIDSDRA